jgi:predicted hydrocarbon binding protein/voltage-gated potassium channel Kch
MKTHLLNTLSSPALLTLLVLAAITLGATGVYMALEGWDFLTALIFTLATITTVGYGNVYPEMRTAEVFTAVLMFVGLAVVATALSTYAARLIKLVAQGVNPMEQNERALRALDNHIVIAAEPDLAVRLVEDFRHRGMQAMAITQDESMHERWLEEGVPTLLGNPDDEDILLRAGIERATGLIVALGSDADNVFVSLSAHDLNPRLRIAARAHAASSIPKLKRSGANEVVSPEEVTAINLAGLFRDRDQIGKAVQEVTAELRDALAHAVQTGGSGSGPRAILFRALRLALQDLSPGMDDTMYALGRQFGRDAVAPNLTGDGLCDSLTRLPALWSSAGLGSIQIAQCHETGAVIREEECSICQGMPKVGRPVCHLERGVISGALEAKLGRAVSAKETKCWGLGDGVCQFDITADVDVHA